MTTKITQQIEKLEDSIKNMNDEIDYLDTIIDKLLEDEHSFEQKLNKLYKEEEFLMIGHLDEQYAPEYKQNKIRFIWDRIKVFNERNDEIDYEIEEINEEIDRLKEKIKEAEDNLQLLE